MAEEVGVISAGPSGRVGPPHTEPVVVSAREQRPSGGGAHGSAAVEPVKPDAVCTPRHLVQVWGECHAPIVAQIPVAKVVGQQENDVGAVWLLGRSRGAFLCLLTVLTSPATSLLGTFSKKAV